MKMKDYVKQSARTATADYRAIGARLTPQAIDLLHAAMGLSTEANEVVDQMKKVLFYGKPLDQTNIKEELGDLMFYMAMICRELDLSFEELATINIEKLKKRYPDGFSEERATNRNLKEELKVLNGKVKR